MKPQDPRDLGAGLLYLVLGGAFALGARQYAQGTAASPGPGFFPFYLGLGLAVLGLVLIVRGLRPRPPTPPGRRARQGDENPANERPAEPLSFPWRATAWVLAGVALFGLTLRPLGLVVAVPLLVLMATRAGGARPAWRFVLALTAGLTLLAWVVFVLGLRLQIPVLPAGWGA